jgi:hypothetical protein
MKASVVRFTFAVALVVGVPFTVVAEEAPVADAGAAPAPAAPPSDEAKAAAKQVVQEYLEAVKAKKWDVAKKVTHPKTLEKIADLLKRTKLENHPMAPWGKMKEEYMTDFSLSEPVASANGAFAVPSTETRFSVEDKGTEDGVKAEYLVIPIAGKYWVTDRRLGENVFPADTLAAAYKGYFEGEYVPPAPVAPVKKGKKK